MSDEARARFVRAVPLFADLAAPDVQSIASRVTALTLPRGTVLTREGEMADTAYQLRSGVVHVTRTKPQPDESTSMFFTGGEVFGDRGLRTGHPERSSSVAFTDVELLALARRDVEELLRDRPGLALALIRGLGSRLEATEASAPPRGPMGRVLPLVSLATGAGRTTLAINLCAAITRLTGARVLLIDASVTGTAITRALGITSDADYV